MWQVICSNPQLTPFSSHVVCPRPNTFRQTRRFLHAMLKTSSTCWTLIIRYIRQKIFWNSKAKGHWKSREAWASAWVWGEGHDVFKINWGAWNLWSWHQGVWGNCQEQRTAATRQEVMRMLTWLRYCLAKEEVFRDSCIYACIFGQWKWWSKIPAYSSRDSAFSLNYHLFVI